MFYKPNLINVDIKSYLKSFYLSDKTIYKLFLENKILVNNININSNYLLKKDDILIIKEEPNDLEPYQYELKIVYEDDYILIIDKPRGYIIHGETNAIDNMVAAYYLNNNLNIKVRHVHRLDRDTTGILVYAKDILTESYFNYHLALHDFKRLYLALVKGKINKDLVIEKNIAKDRHNNNKYIVHKNGKYAKTIVKVLKHIASDTLVEVTLETGRTHQIRVHMLSIMHPLLNDPIYNPGSGFMYLRSYKFIFTHPHLNKEIKVELKYEK